MALGEKGLFKISRESFVICARRRDAAVERRWRGCGAVEVVLRPSPSLSALRELLNWAMRVLVVDMEFGRDWRSADDAIAPWIL